MIQKKDRHEVSADVPTWRRRTITNSSTILLFHIAGHPYPYNPKRNISPALPVAHFVRFSGDDSQDPERDPPSQGVKIAIMGCIVNGPGEMADADFGYVGSGPGKITLYKGKEVVKRGVDSAIAVQELINLLKESDAWIEPEPVVSEGRVAS